MANRIGRYTLELPSCPVITGSAGVVGKKEGEGPLSAEFNYIFEDTTMGEESWEKAESTLIREAVMRALNQSKKAPSDIDYIFAGDLLNQCIGTTFGLRELNMPFVGVYGACSTMALSLSMAAIFTDAGLCAASLAATSSHFCSAERQYRYPLEYGGQRTPTAQWTVTGAGAAVVEPKGTGPCINAVTTGRILDLGIKDANNMGAAMAPAAACTIADFLNDTGTKPDDYDLILTGDLGAVGSDLVNQLLVKDYNFDIGNVHNDCGLMIFDREKQDVHAGGSGCGCSASVLCSHVLNNIKSGQLKKVLFVATGALLSPTSSKQGESIPAIAHAVLLTGGV